MVYKIRFRADAATAYARLAAWHRKPILMQGDVAEKSSRGDGW